MSVLDYRTRGNSSPQGRERVYFTCHPADFALYFESICEDIFRTQNCAIWYRTDMADSEGECAENKVTSKRSLTLAEKAEQNSEKTKVTDISEDLALDLGQMQLFVIPVTSRFLHQPNRAREAEFQFAMEHHIPVLPLMQESGLESEFNRICGDLQFLDKQAALSDFTAIPYEEKLKTFLSSVLLGDDLAAKVRAVFDAYIFLSYRKKDRKYAQELMRLIHKNAFCRDIAIWYDEFLTPGENFNDAIRAAMEKSSLFAMVVTPNLVNEVNYVMTTEYPKASEVGMPILPAQLAETDVDALKDSYPGIHSDDITDAHDEAALSEAISAALEKKMTREQMDKIRGIAFEETGTVEDPQHIFFIGLAYLGGIDVEVNTARAADLITRAADAGLDEAMEKLVNMYRNGEGVPRNHETAIRWQEKLTDHCRAEYEKTRSEGSARRYFYRLETLGNYLWELQQIGKAKEISLRILKLALELRTRFGGETYERLVAVPYTNLGALCMAEGDLKTAREYCEKGEKIFEKLAEKSRDFRVRLDLSRSCANLAKLCVSEGDMRAAEEYCQKAKDVCETLAVDAECGESETQPHEAGMDEVRADEIDQTLILCYYNMAGIYKMTDQLEKAREYYEKAREKGLEMEEGTCPPQIQYLIFMVCVAAGEIWQMEGALDKARKYYEEACDLSEKLSEETGMPGNHRNLAVAYMKLGENYEAEGNIEKARDYYEKSQDILMELEEDAWTLETGSVAIASGINLGQIYQAEGDTERAKKCLEMALEMAEMLSAETDMTEIGYNVLACYANLGQIYQTEGDLEEARKYFEKGLQKGKELSIRTEMTEISRILSSICRSLGKICETEGELEKARQYYEKGSQIIEKLTEKADTVENQRGMCSSYRSQGDLCQENGDLQKAREYHEKAFMLEEKLVQETGTVEDRRDLTVSCNSLGDISLEQGDRKKAMDYYEEGLHISEKLAKETGMMEDFRGICVFLSRIADILEKDGNLQEARENYEKAVQISEKLAKSGREESRSDLSVFYFSLAKICRQEGNFEKAKTYYEKYVQIMGQLIEKDSRKSELFDFGLAHYYLGDLCKKEGNLEEARVYYEKYRQVCETIEKNKGTVNSLYNLGLAYYYLGDVCKREGNLEKAREYLERYRQLSGELAKRSVTESTYHNMALACYYLGKLDENHPDYDMLKQAFYIWHKLAEQYPSVPTYKQYAKYLAGVLAPLYQSDHS